MTGNPNPFHIDRPLASSFKHSASCATGWQAITARRAQEAAAHTFLVLLLAVSLETLGIALREKWLLYLSRWVAATVVVLELCVVALGTWMVLKTVRHLLKYRKALPPSYVRWLWRLLRMAVPLVLWAWLLAAATVSLPLIMDLPARVPISGLIFVPVMLCFGVQWIRLSMLVGESHRLPAIYELVA